MLIRGITISVNYSHVLAITLPRNMRHMSECLVITSQEDRETQELVNSTERVSLLVTDAFTRHGAYFNKGLAFEEGFDVLGRHGQILIWDSDILFPSTIPWGLIRPGFLNGCKRRICDPLSKWSETLDWRSCPTHLDGGPIGFWQCFQADDPRLAKRPWYSVNFPHAGGGDAYFVQHWDAAHRCVLPFECLHLGPVDRYWFGTSPEAIERMGAYVHRQGWQKAMRKHDPKSIERVGELLDRVDVPGYEASDYRMPFERRVTRDPRKV